MIHLAALTRKLRLELGVVYLCCLSILFLCVVLYIILYYMHDMTHTSVETST